jgi:hypothetical protein
VPSLSGAGETAREGDEVGVCRRNGSAILLTAREGRSEGVAGSGGDGGAAEPGAGDSGRTAGRKKYECLRAIVRDGLSGLCFQQSSRGIRRNGSSNKGLRVPTERAKRRSSMWALIPLESGSVADESVGASGH